MPCCFPLKAHDTGAKTFKGGRKIKVLPRGSADVGKDIYGRLVEAFDVPCGRCMECRLDYSREWAVRSYFEAKEWKDNYFVTLTYNNDCLPHGVGWDNDTGVIKESNTLDPSHLKKFIKDVRRYWSYHFKHDGIRFIAAGEYGDETHRPHYHLIMYNLPIDDLVFVSKGRKTGSYYSSKIIESIWAKGKVIIANVSFETSAYVARYVLKKQTGKDSRLHYEQRGEHPEFVRHSRRPGIGYSYFAKNYLSIYSNDSLYVNRGGKVITCRPVAYYDRLLAEGDYQLGWWLDMIKAKRVALADSHKELALRETDLNEFEVAEIKYFNKLKSIEKLHKFKV